MKKFTKNEQELIEDLYSSRNNGAFLSNHLFEKLRDGESVLVDPTKGSFKLVFANDDANPSNDVVNAAIARMEEVQEYAVRVAHLLKYLEQQGLILTLSSTHAAGAGTQSIEKGLSSTAPITRDFPDMDVNRLLLGYLNKKIFTTPDLDDFVQNSFVSAEDRKYRETLKWTKVAIGVAIVIGLASILLPLFRDARDDLQSSSEQAPSAQEEVKNLRQHQERVWRELFGRLDRIMPSESSEDVTATQGDR